MLGALVVLHAAKTPPGVASLAPKPEEPSADLPLSNGYFRPTPHGGTGDPNARTPASASSRQPANPDTKEDKVRRFAEAAAEQQADSNKAEAQRKKRKARAAVAGQGRPEHAASDADQPWLSGWSPNQMAALFETGKPSNDLSKVGLVVHGFDFTEDEQDPWKPCEQEWCYNMTRAWSTSIVNAKQSHILNPSGIVFNPTSTVVLCSWHAANTAMNVAPGCEGAPYPPERLKDMLKKSMDSSKKATISTSNEVLIDASNYVDNLPGSVAAIMFFNDATAEDKIIATRAYVALLDKYQVTEAEIPLLKVNRGADEQGNRLSSPKSVETVMDVSASARNFLAKQSVEKLLKHHPNRKGDMLRKRLQSRKHDEEPASKGAHRGGSGS